MSSSLSHTLLVLLRLDIDAPNPIRVGGTDTQGRLKRLDKEKGYYLLAGILDPSQRTTSAPLTHVKLEGENLLTYNRILHKVEGLSDRYYGPEGYIDHPDTFDSRAQEGLYDEISDLGQLIYQLFDEEGHPVRSWLERLIPATEPEEKGKPSGDRPLQPVTIITNDFNIPWYWLKRKQAGMMLCEVCSLGMLQLRSGHNVENHRFPKESACRALLINGSPDVLPFAGEVLDDVSRCLQAEERRGRTSGQKFAVEIASSREQVMDLCSKHAEHKEGEHQAQAFQEFRIVHFSGHYSERELYVGGRLMPEHIITPFVSDAMLVLDGCSSAQGLKAWTDVEGITSRLINHGGALGCVVTVLPVKDDPIAGKLFVREFYSMLRRGASPVGYALAKARIGLRDYFHQIGSNSPMWALYQLIGSPVVTLFDEE